MRKCRKAYGRRDWRRKVGCAEGLREQQEYKEMRLGTKKRVAQPKNKVYDELFEGLDNTKGEKT